MHHDKKRYQPPPEHPSSYSGRNKLEKARLFVSGLENAEVDLLIEKHGRVVAAVEIKSTTNVSGADLSGLRSFREEYPKTPCYVASQAAHSFQLDDVNVLPWMRYLKLLENWL